MTTQTLNDYHEYIAFDFTLEDLESMAAAGYDMFVRNGVLYVSIDSLIRLANKSKC